VKTYLEAVTQLQAFHQRRGRGLPEAGRGDVKAFLSQLLRRFNLSTAANRQRVQRAFTPGSRTKVRSKPAP